MDANIRMQTLPCSTQRLRCFYAATGHDADYFLMEIAMKPRRDTRVRNLVFFITVISALVVGLWLAR